MAMPGLTSPIFTGRAKRESGIRPGRQTRRRRIFQYQLMNFEEAEYCGSAGNRNHQSNRVSCPSSRAMVALAGKSKSKVSIVFNDKTVNAKSMLNLLGAGIRQGSKILLMVEGEDEQETLAALTQLIKNLSE